MCGIALIRLLKPLEFYHQKYGTAFYGLNKLRLLLQKQRNRGQDGAGVATIKLSPDPGTPYINRNRSNANDYLADVFRGIYQQFEHLTPEQLADTAFLKSHVPFMGELLLGHLRYGTHGANGIQTCHPFLRRNNWITRNLVLAGNFNMTNVDELFDELVSYGQYPKEKSDTVTVLEKIGHFLDSEVQRLFDWYKSELHDNRVITEKIIEELDVRRVLQRASKRFDGGYVMAGMIGHGDAFVMRDPNGIRPAFYFHNEEVVAVASERPAIQTAFRVHCSKIKELAPAHALVIKKNGAVSEVAYTTPRPQKSCSFERIYFSRGTDQSIYLERKKLGKLLAKTVLKAVSFDIERTVFSYVPNTAESAFLGLVEGVESRLNESKLKKILELGKDAKGKKLDKIMSLAPRVEKIVVKDAKLRTFIADEASRGDLISHVYDVTYGIVHNDKDNLVLLDDSIVRGATLRDSILRIVSRLRPKKIVIVSSAPQIRYPDCYGIDMSRMKDFVAFKALVALLEEHNKNHLLQEAYERCKAQENLPSAEIKNELIALYDTFSYNEISKKIAEIVTPKGIKPKVEVIYQTIENLHEACPNHKGDWYFSGIYPTPGGNKVVNKAFINYMEKSDARSY